MCKKPVAGCADETLSLISLALKGNKYYFALSFICGLDLTT